MPGESIPTPSRQEQVMAFSDTVEMKFHGLRRSILNHPFTTGIGDGTLDIEKFKFYVRQDYLYLIDYSRVLAMASARSGTLESMGWFARLLHETLNTEMDLHRDYCAQFGISAKELEETQKAPTTLWLYPVPSIGCPPQLFPGACIGFAPMPVGLLGDWRLSQSKGPAGARAPVQPVDRHVRL